VSEILPVSLTTANSLSAAPLLPLLCSALTSSSPPKPTPHQPFNQTIHKQHQYIQQHNTHRLQLEHTDTTIIMEAKYSEDSNVLGQRKAPMGRQGGKRDASEEKQVMAAHKQKGRQIIGAGEEKTASPAMRAGIPPSPALAALSPALSAMGAQGEVDLLQLGHQLAFSNSRNLKKTMMASTVGAGVAVKRDKTLTITGRKTAEARAEEARLSKAVKIDKIEPITTYVDDQLKTIFAVHDEYMGSRAIQEQKSKVRRFISQTSQWLDKLGTLVYPALLERFPPKEMKASEIPPLKMRRRFARDPNAIIVMLMRHRLAVNDKLWDLTQIQPMGGPGFESTLAECLQLLHKHSSLQHEFLWPFMQQNYSEKEQMALGRKWAEHLLRAKTNPQPPVVTDELTKRAYLSGLDAHKLARFFQERLHVY